MRWWRVQLAEVYRRLEAGSYRLTPQRHLLLRTLAGHGGIPLSAEELQGRAEADHRLRVGLATVYRTLDLLVSLSVVARVEPSEQDASRGQDGAARFVWAGDAGAGQPTRVCVRCGEVDVISRDWLQDMSRRLRDEQGFEVVDHEVRVYGVCQPCRGRKALGPADVEDLPAAPA